MENVLYSILIIVSLIQMYFYGMQRYVQLISREIDIPFKLGKLVMLPAFYGVTFLLSLGKYGLAVFLMIYFEWSTVLFILIPIFLINSFAPIPYKILYRDLIYKTLSNKMKIFPEHMKTIIKIQIESKILN